MTNNIKSRINTVLISPRRWGKTSLVNKVAHKLKGNPNYKFCFIDLFNIRDENEFYRIFAANIIKISSNKSEEWSRNALQLFSKLKPKISFGIDPVNDFEISFDIDEKSNDYRDILNLPEAIAIKKKINIVICIDEFQNLSYFKDPLLFQKRLRSAWQDHKNVSYCIYGSKRHLMLDIFSNKSMPFYKFGDTIYLQKISPDDLIPFIVEKFKSTGKQIEETHAKEIVMKMECHPYYTQQLSFITWNNTENKVSDKILDKSLNDLVYQNAFLYEKDFDQLSNKQVQFLKVILDGVAGGFSSAPVITKYNLGNSATVSKVIKALKEKEVLDRSGGKIEFLDPVFKLWLKKIF
jgi:uncharacterized protein